MEFGPIPLSLASNQIWFEKPSIRLKFSYGGAIAEWSKANGLRDEGAVALQEEAYQEDVDAFSDRCRQRDDAVRSRDSVQAADEVRQVVLED